MAQINTPFINIQTDFGFKRVFGSEKHKHVLIQFLNALFEEKLIVKDVTYHNKEIIPSEEKGKRIIYDVYCSTPAKRSDSSFFPDDQTKNEKGGIETDHHFILEMQNIYTPPFEERMVFYASKMVSEQGKAGWNYELEPVFAVAVTDFNIGHMMPRMVRDVMLADRETLEPLTDKLHIYLCSLKEVPAEWKDCRTVLEEMLYLIKNIEKMDSSSLAYREGRYTEFFEAARSNRLTETEAIAYSQSLDKLRETQAGFRYAADKAREEGKAEGIAEGEKKKAVEIARAAKAMGLGIEQISQLTNLSAIEIKKL